MDRRGFLSLLGQAAVGATVVYSFPSIVVPKNIQPYGLAHFINEGHTFRGLTTSTFPVLNAPSLDLGGAVLSPEMFEYAKRNLQAMVRQTSKNPMLMFL
jgi:hypothetical protein